MIWSSPRLPHNFFFFFFFSWGFTKEMISLNDVWSWKLSVAEVKKNKNSFFCRRNLSSRKNARTTGTTLTKARRPLNKLFRRQIIYIKKKKKNLTKGGLWPSISGSLAFRPTIFNSFSSLPGSNFTFTIKHSAGEGGEVAFVFN